MQYKYQIFISSTYEDLLEERQVAINKVMKLRHIPAGMELFGVPGVEQWEYIRKEIDESDYYLLILAGRYGSLNRDGIGYTELEYDYARKKGKHIIPFLVKNIADLPHGKCEREEVQRERLQKFRTKIEKQILVEHWTDLHDLETKIGESLANVIAQYPAKTKWVRVSDDEEGEEVCIQELKDDSDEVLLQSGSDGYYHTEIAAVREGIREEYRCYKIKGHVEDWKSEDAPKTDWLLYKTGKYEDLKVGDKVRFQIVGTRITEWPDLGLARDIYPTRLKRENN